MPDSQVSVAFASIVALIVITPGPNLFLLLRNTPSFGWRIGLANVSGICAAVPTHASLSLLGVSALIVASATLFEAVKLLGAAYLAWLGFKSLRAAVAGVPPSQAAPPVAGSQTEPSLAAAWGQGWAVNLLNPKPALFYLAAFSQFVDPAAGSVVLQGMALAGIHVFIAAVWYGSVVLGIGKMSSWLQRRRVWQAIEGLSGVALIGLGTRLLFVRAPQP